MDQAYLFNRGLNYMSYNLLGAHPACAADGTAGYRFAVWAPKAQAVSVVGGFNDWDDKAHPLTMQGRTGIWTGFVGGARQWDRYKYAVRGVDGRTVLKADPYARHAELRPNTASILYDPNDYQWHDGQWLQERPSAVAARPLNIYEVHLGSWRRRPDGSFLSYREVAVELAEYACDMGFNAIELMPVLEHPLDMSWGYQVTGYFAPTSRFGTPADFKYLVDILHQHRLSVILDWVPAHFPRDEFALARFDGSAQYEYADTRIGEHPDWGTLVFDYSKLEVHSFLMSAAWFWLDEFHLDGLRVDAVSSMLYLNFGREHQKLRNRHGGSDNLDSVAFLRKLNTIVRKHKPGCLMIAEESTPWPRITEPAEAGGLGFTHKWNMGWMNDVLDYFSEPHEQRSQTHHKLTFSMTYAFSERFILPLSHDEVVHGKKSLIGRMPGDYWQKFADLRALSVLRMSHPGGKLLFMGGEFAQFIEWRYDEQLEWFLLDYPQHAGYRDCLRELNRLYAAEPALWLEDDSWAGFRWLQADDVESSVYAFLRSAVGAPDLLIVLNLTPAPCPEYRLTGLPERAWQVVHNTDDRRYGGSDWLLSAGAPPRREGDVLTIDLPPLCGMILKADRL